MDLERSLADLKSSLTSLHESTGVVEDTPELQPGRNRNRMLKVTMSRLKRNINFAAHGVAVTVSDRKREVQHFG
jgi:hypothetical protein